MGSYYKPYISDHDPVDEMYDWSIIGIPGDVLVEGGLDSTPDGSYAEERWKETKLPDVWVSNFGRFYNVKTGNYLTPTHGDGHGHKAVKAGNKDEVRHQGYAHRLLAEAFIPNPYNDPIVRHLDDDPSNNELENLAWGTQKENHEDSVRNGTYRPVSAEAREKSYEMSRQPVQAINLKTGKELYFGSINDAARSLHLQQANVCKVLKGDRPHTENWTFRRLTKEEYYECFY